MTSQRRFAFEQSLSLASVVGVEAGTTIIQDLYGVESIESITEDYVLPSGVRFIDLAVGHNNTSLSLHHELSRLEFKLQGHSEVQGTALGNNGAITPQLFGHSIRDIKLALSRITVPSPWDLDHAKLYRSVCGGEHPLNVFSKSSQLLLLGSELGLQALRSTVNKGCGQSDQLELKRVGVNLWSGASIGAGISIQEAVHSATYKIFLPMTKADTRNISEETLGWLSSYDAFRFAHGFNGGDAEGMLVCVQDDKHFYSYTL